MQLVLLLLVALLSPLAVAVDEEDAAAELVTAADSELAKPSEPRASRAKRRGGSEVLRG